MNEQLSDKKNEPIRFLVFSVSLRNDSLNTRLAKLAAQVIKKMEALQILQT
jgi:chromate reductase